MAKLSIAKGATSVLVRIFIQSSASATGAGLTGLTNASASLTCYQMRDDDGNAGGTSIALQSATRGTWTTRGFVEKDATNCPGWYEFGVPNAALATGSRSVNFHFQGATNMAPCPIEIELTGWDNADAVHGGMSALPNTSCTTNASLLTSGTGTDQLSVTSGRIDIGKALGTAVTLDTNNVLNVSTKYLAGTSCTGRDIGASVLLSTGTGTGQLDFTSGVVKANATQWLGGTIPAVNVTGVPLVDLKYTLGTISPAAAGYVALDWGQITNKTTTNALTGTTIATSQVVASVSGAVGSVTGAVGSVTGAVGSVTGNVGGNVVGSVASVTAAVTLSAGDSPIIQTGTAGAGSATTITIATAAGTTADLVGCKIKITSGTGANQERVITGYVNSTKVVTVNYAWVTNPDNTSVYAILFDNAPKIDSSLKISGVVLADTITTYTGNTVQTGDAYTRIGAAGVGLTNLGDTRIANLDTTVSSRGTSTLTQTQVTGGAYSVQSASCVLGDARIAHLDADISSRMATYTQPSGFLAATFPTGTIANTTNITAATGITVSTNNDKTGYSLTQSFPSNFASLGISAGGHVLNVDTLTTYTGDTPQTGDSFARIGATGSGLTSLAPSSTALSTGTWTGARAGYLDNLNIGGAVASHADAATIDADVLTRAPSSTALSTATWTSGRAANLDNLDTTISSRTKPADTQAAVTLVTTTTNLTNAATSGDFTATMKTSLGTAVGTAQTGDSFAVVNSGTFGNSALHTQIGTPMQAGSTVSVDMTEAVPTTNTANTLGDCLNAARAQGFGAWNISGATLTLYAPDGVTPVRIFTLNSATAPTARV